MYDILRNIILECIARRCLLTRYMKLWTRTSMQTLQSVYEMEETKRKNNLLEVLSDVYCRTILKSTLHKPKSAIEISREESVPMSTVYRRLQILQDANLVSLSGTISNDGGKTFFYKSKIKEIEAKYEDGQVEVKAVFSK